jgi:predicted PurR-regulated permease PerM
MTAQQTFRNTVIVLATLAAAYALVVGIRIIIVLLVAIIIASAVRPAVLWLTQRRIPQGLAITLIYLLLGIFTFGLAIAVIPPAANRLAGYIENEDRLANQIIRTQDWIIAQVEARTGNTLVLLDPDGIRETVTSVVTQLREEVPALAGEFGGLFGDFILTVVMGIYWLTSRNEAVAFLSALFPIGRRAEIAQVIIEIEQAMGTYIRGIVLVATFVGMANFILLTVLGVPNALTLGFIIGVSTMLPVIGGFIGAGVAVLLALLSSPLHAVLTFISFVAVQQIEVHYLTPRTMARSVNLNPILVILFLFIGAALGGVVGAIIAVPLAGTAMILVRHFIVEPLKDNAAPQRVSGGILIAGAKDAEQPVVETNSQTAGRNNT